MAYIDRDKVLEELNKVPAYFESGDIRYGIEIAIDTINKQPTADVVEIVRCEKCIHRTEDDFCFKVASDVVPKKVKGDFFCGYGERKEVEKQKSTQLRVL